MTCRLAVMTTYLGRPTETHVRRHLLDLDDEPSAIVGVTARLDTREEPEFPGHPCLVLHEAFPYLIRPPASRAEIQPIFTRLRRFLQKHRVRALLCQYLDFACFFVEFAEELGLTFVARAHGADASSRLREPGWRARYQILNRAAAIVAVSHAMKRDLEAAGIDPAKIHVMTTGVDVPDRPGPHAPHEGVRAVAVGRMTDKKAPIYLLDAFRRALPHVPGLRLDVIGDGPLLGAAQQFVHAMTLNDVVQLHGEQTHQDALRRIRDCDLFLQHSIVDPLTGDSEGTPTSVLEAMAAGRPIVATRHAGIPEVVEDGVSGLLADEGDTAGMADRIVTLANNRDLRVRMGASGWARVREGHSWDLERRRLRGLLGLEHAALPIETARAALKGA